MALAVLMGANLIFTPGFAEISFRNGAFYGAMIDVLDYGSRLALVAIGMTLVIALRGVDLSVGATLAISGAVAASLVTRGVSFPVALLAALAASMGAGLFNGSLITLLRAQPIVATLVLMVCGRGVAQLITAGQVITFDSAPLAWLGSGALAGIPVPVVILLLGASLLALCVHRTGLGLLIRATGENPVAARGAGSSPRRLIIAAYALTALLAGLAGLIAAGDIRAADANRAGLFLELDAILAVVIGGTSLKGGRFTLLGTIVGAMLIQTLTTSLYMHDVRPDLAPIPKALLVLAVCFLSERSLLPRRRAHIPPDQRGAAR